MKQNFLFWFKKNKSSGMIETGLVIWLVAHYPTLWVLVTGNLCIKYCRTSVTWLCFLPWRSSMQVFPSVFPSEAWYLRLFFIIPPPPKKKKRKPTFKNRLYELSSVFFFHELLPLINAYGNNLIGKWYLLLDVVKQQSAHVGDQIQKFYGLLKWKGAEGEPKAFRNITVASCTRSVQLNKQLVMDCSLCLTVGYLSSTLTLKWLLL